MSTAIAELNEATFDEEVRSSDLAVVVEFWAEWCPPCKMIAPVLDSIAVEFADSLRVYKINSDDNPELSRRYDVMSIPTILVFTDGEMTKRMVGARSRTRLLEELADYLG
jgi:thioredoxin 1